MSLFSTVQRYLDEYEASKRRKYTDGETSQAYAGDVDDPYFDPRQFDARELGWDLPDSAVISGALNQSAGSVDALSKAEADYRSDLQNERLNRSASGINADGTVNYVPGVNGSSSSSSSDPLSDFASILNANQLALLRSNSAESERLWRLQKDWQTEMANTAHQREAADLRAAGFNPILTAVGSPTNGASTGGSTANPAFSPAQGNEFADVLMAVFSGLSKIISSVKH